MIVAPVALDPVLERLGAALRAAGGERIERVGSRIEVSTRPLLLSWMRLRGADHASVEILDAAGPSYREISSHAVIRVSVDAWPGVLQAFGVVAAFSVLVAAQSGSSAAALAVLVSGGVLAVRWVPRLVAQRVLSLALEVVEREQNNPDAAARDR